VAGTALRAEAGRNPHDKSLTDLIGELTTRREKFRTHWARHNVKPHRTASKRLHSSLGGDLHLTGEAIELVGDGLVIITYTAEPDSPAPKPCDSLPAGPPNTPTPQPNAQTPLKRTGNRGGTRAAIRRTPPIRPRASKLPPASRDGTVDLTVFPALTR
jgi:hypothetical protein